MKNGAESIYIYIRNNFISSAVIKRRIYTRIYLKTGNGGGGGGNRYPAF